MVKANTPRRRVDGDAVLGRELTFSARWLTAGLAPDGVEDA
jgi:hypothetical protein